MQIFKAIPHNSKCRYGERGAADAKPKAQIILDAAKVSAASGGNSEPKQGQRSQSARGFCPRSTMRVPQPDIIEHFGNADAVPQLPERCLSRKAGIVRCCPNEKTMLLLPTLLLYALGLLLTGIGSRLASRCATWCGALCGLPMWMVGGTLVAVCTALPQLVLAFLAAGMSVTALAVGTALAGAVTQLGLVLALCLLRCNVTVDRGELLRKCALLLVACGVVALFVRDGTLSYTGTGLLMGLFVLFVMQSIAYQYRFAFREGLELITVQKEKGEKPPPEDPSGRTVLFPAMSIRTSLRNLAGVVGGMAVLCVGAWALLNSAVALANLTGTIQAQWAATLISFGLCLPLLVEVFDHPLGSAWKRFAEKCRIYPPQALPMQVLNSAILSITLVLPVSSLMYRRRLPVGEQFRQYDIPFCVLMALILLLPPLVKKRLYRWQGRVCLILYVMYLAAVLIMPRAGA